MSDTVKQAGIKQADGTYLMKDIGVDYSNVDGLDTAATAFKAKSADKATADKNNKDITEYIASGSKSNGNLVLTKGDGTSSSVDLSMKGATSTTNGEAGFVPQPTSADNNKFLKGNGTWSELKIKIYQGSDNIEIDSSDDSIDLTDSTVVSGTYGPSADVVGTNGTSIVIPRFAVDAKGRLTSAGQQTYTSVDTQYGVLNGLYQGGLGNTMFGLDAHSLDGPDYGEGNTENYGHVKLSHTYKSLVSGVGIAASQQGLYNAYNELNKKMGNDYTDITSDFDNGTFSKNLSNYNPGNYIVKQYGNSTYVAVLADYNTFHFYYSGSAFSSVEENHWVAIVLGFSGGVMHIDPNPSMPVDFINTEMNTWLKQECSSMVEAIFGLDHIIEHGCLLPKSISDPSKHAIALSSEWEPHKAMLLSEAQLGCRVNSVSGMDTGEACKPLKIFQNESFMSVVGRDYGQLMDTTSLYSAGAWLRDRSDDHGTMFCAVSFANTLESIPMNQDLARIPIILLK